LVTGGESILILILILILSFFLNKLSNVFCLQIAPYVLMSNEDVIQFVIKGGRLDKPAKCPDELYQLMLRCWNANPEQRPDFGQALQELKSIAKKYAGEEGGEVLANSLASKGSNHYEEPMG
jgi:hypothetical protein